MDRALQLPELPIIGSLDEIEAALSSAGAAVLQAEPGAGKTTIVPLHLLGADWLGDQRIVMLEPRRVAARAAATRMASLLGEDVGATVGFRTRDERRVSRDTRIEVVTEGMLTRSLQRDPELPGVGLVILDEFHERSLPADIGLALLLDSREVLRPDLRILVMSATIEVDRVAKLVGGPTPAPVVQSPGRAHRIDVHWFPPDAGERLERAVVRAVLDAVEQFTGNVLVFLPGVGEISRVQDDLVDRLVDVDVVPLHGSLPPAEQDAAIRGGRRRRVVLSTDVAETSVTVEGVEVVVDSGVRRSPRFDTGTGMTRLETVNISVAAADQRAGRAGRLGPGHAIRLWTAHEHLTRQAHEPAELTQVELSGLVLELAAWGVTDPASLSFLDQPPARAFNEGRALLKELGALDESFQMTDLGRAMHDLPMHPRLARSVIAALEMGRGATGCHLAALLEDRDVFRGRPSDLPADITDRLRVMTGEITTHRSADRGAVRRARKRSSDLARRIGVSSSQLDIPIDPYEAGAALAAGYPDRIARRRDGGAPGERSRFALSGGGGAFVEGADSLAGEQHLVAIDLDGDRREARVRMGAPVLGDDIEIVLGDVIHDADVTEWDPSRKDFVRTVGQRLGQLWLGSSTRRPEAGPGLAAAISAVVGEQGLPILNWTPAARALQSRAALVGSVSDVEWPEITDAALLAQLDEWLTPLLWKATGRKDLERVDLVEALRGRLGWEQAKALDRLAPTEITLSNGLNRRIDYSGEHPVIATRVQDLFGVDDGPRIVDGKIPVVLHLLSPARRPVQVTSDLAGFWSGSWSEVRKEMAGRYPKHDWPIDPTAP
ncbi:MAG: ATP-dependent helicase HrpB [Candidatus Poriferisodalaceae bacterium]|jgi:ATP-dependent helicase HrpB